MRGSPEFCCLREYEYYRQVGFADLVAPMFLIAWGLRILPTGRIGRSSLCGGWTRLVTKATVSGFLWSEAWPWLLGYGVRQSPAAVTTGFHGTQPAGWLPCSLAGNVK
jgi:hypothetical protein